MVGLVLRLCLDIGSRVGSRGLGLFKEKEREVRIVVRLRRYNTGSDSSNPGSGSSDTENGSSDTGSGFSDNGSGSSVTGSGTSLSCLSGETFVPSLQLSKNKE